MTKPLRALFVEDSPADAELLLAELRRGGFDVTCERVDTADEMRTALERATWDLVISDFNMPAFSGMAALHILQSTGRDLPFIVVSGMVGEETAVAAMKAGAHDFLVKGRLARLVPAIERELRDAEERRTRLHLEDRLRQSQKMEAIGRLAGSIAHDFNNMLTAILGYAELMTEEVGPAHALSKDMAEIVAAAQRAAALTRQLLAFSRKQPLAVEPLDLTAAVRGVEPMLRRLIGEHIAVDVTLTDDIYPVLADTTQLDQVLMNLSLNARDAMTRGGVLTIETRNVEIDAAFVRDHPDAHEGPCARLTVRDTGVGMTPEILAQIFEPFFTTKERGHGTGLGLAAVYGIVKQLSAYIWVESEPGRGSAFHIDFAKTARPALAAALAATAAGRRAGHETVLLVEDEESVRHFAKTALERHGYRVLEAATGETAAAMIEAMVPLDLVLTDVILPGMNGRELATAAKRVRPQARVLFMSGYADWPGEIRGRLDDGSTVELIEKPFTAGALLAKVRDVISAALQ
jgi:signal transduction histidine kinase